MDLLKNFEMLFRGRWENVSERVTVLEADMERNGSDLPEITDIESILSRFPKRDDVELTLNDGREMSFKICNRDATWQAGYQAYIADIHHGDELTIELRIEKKCDQGTWSVYCWDKFWEDLLGLTIPKMMEAFVLFYDKYEHIVFEVYDKNVRFQTGTMAFGPENEVYEWTSINRYRRLAQCRETSGFLEQDIYSLIPEDFALVGNTARELFYDRFGQLENLLSLAYLAAGSSLDQAGLNLELDEEKSIRLFIRVDEIRKNEALYKLYQWIFEGEHTVDRALLARNIVFTNRAIDSQGKLQHITMDVLESVKRKYNLYIKENVEKYIELTNAMAGYIKESTQAIGACLSQLFAHLKGNLIAVLSFIFTAILANIVSEKGTDEIFTYEITWVLYLVLLGSLFYFLISIAEVSVEKKRLCEQYDDLLSHYQQVLSKADINTITCNDEPRIKAEKKLKNGIILWSIVWIFLIFSAAIVIYHVGEGRSVIADMMTWFSWCGTGNP